MQHAIRQLKRAHERYSEALNTALKNRDRASHEVLACEHEMNVIQREMEDMEVAIIVLEAAAERAAMAERRSPEIDPPTAQKVN